MSDPQFDIPKEVLNLQKRNPFVAAEEKSVECELSYVQSGLLTMAAVLTVAVVAAKAVKR